MILDEYVQVPDRPHNDETEMPVKLDLRTLYTENIKFLREWGIRQEAIREFEKASECHTEALGAEVYMTESGEERIVWHTCKSRCCPSCGYYRSILWMDDICSRIPDLPFTSLVFTMRAHLWEIFRRNSTLLRALPEIGARAAQEWARDRYGADVAILVVQHTFGAALNFNVHLHLIALNVGLSSTNERVIQDICYSPEEITDYWRRTLVAYLLAAVKEGWVKSELAQGELLESISMEAGANDWIPLVKKMKSTHQYLRYMGRYLCRQPIANNRLIPSEHGMVRFNYWRRLKGKEPSLPEDVRTRFGTRKRLSEKAVSIKHFFHLLADQIPDRYTHGVRYFGLLAPRSAKRYERFLQLLGKATFTQKHQKRSWLSWMWRSFNINPLQDSGGRPLKWIRSMPPRPKGTVK